MPACGRDYGTVFSLPSHASCWPSGSPHPPDFDPVRQLLNYGELWRLRANDPEDRRHRNAIPIMTRAMWATESEGVICNAVSDECEPKYYT